MNILLVNPCWPYPYGKGEHTYNRIWPPLSLLNCASLLETEGHTVTILDAHAQRVNASGVSYLVKGYDKIFITSSTLDKWICPNIHIEPFIETAKSIRMVTEELYVMGYHGTADPQKILSQTKAKAIILGEPEIPVINICKNIPLKEISNIAFKEGKAVFNNMKDEKCNLQLFPIPAYHQLAMNSYRYEILGNHFMLFETHRGCQYQCQFCSKLMTGSKIRYKKREQVIKELETAITQNNVRTGYFIDLDFLCDKGFAASICDFLIDKKYHFKWCCQTRPDHLNLDILTQMKQAGCELIHLGVETGQQKYLDLTQKNLSLEQTETAIKHCEKAGIKTLAFYLFGLKGETPEDRESTFAFAKKLNTDFVSFHKIYPYENTNIHMPRLEEEKAIEIFIRKKILRYYFRLQYLKKFNFSMAFRCAKLLFGRLLTLK